MNTNHQKRMFVTYLNAILTIIPYKKRKINVLCFVLAKISFLVSGGTINKRMKEKNNYISLGMRSLEMFYFIFFS